MAADDPYARMIEFLELATGKGVRRFVPLSMASLPAGGPAHGEVHRWLIDNTADWAVLCASAFMQNFSEGPSLQSIRDEDTIYSNTEDGQVSFIDVADIASAARAALTAPAALNAAFILTGDEAIAYDRVAERSSRWAALRGRPTR
jgi:festuclavine dehydrogenase